MRQSIEHTKNVLEDKVARVEENLEHIENCVQEMYDYQLDPAFIEDKLTILTRKKHRQIKLQRLQKVRILAFGSLVHQINSL